MSTTFPRVIKMASDDTSDSRVEDIFIVPESIAAQNSTARRDFAVARGVNVNDNRKPESPPQAWVHTRVYPPSEISNCLSLCNKPNEQDFLRENLMTFSGIQHPVSLTLEPETAFTPSKGEEGGEDAVSRYSNTPLVEFNIMSSLASGKVITTPDETVTRGSCGKNLSQLNIPLGILCKKEVDSTQEYHDTTAENNPDWKHADDVQCDQISTKRDDVALSGAKPAMVTSMYASPDTEGKWVGCMTIPACIASCANSNVDTPLSVDLMACNHGSAISRASSEEINRQQELSQETPMEFFFTSQSALERSTYRNPKFPTEVSPRLPTSTPKRGTNARDSAYPSLPSPPPLHVRQQSLSSLVSYSFTTSELPLSHEAARMQPDHRHLSGTALFPISCGSASLFCGSPRAVVPLGFGASRHVDSLFPMTESMPTDALLDVLPCCESYAMSEKTVGEDSHSNLLASCFHPFNLSADDVRHLPTLLPPVSPSCKSTSTVPSGWAALSPDMSATTASFFAMRTAMRNGTSYRSKRRASFSFGSLNSKEIVAPVAFPCNLEVRRGTCGDLKRSNIPGIGSIMKTKEKSENEALPMYLNDPDMPRFLKAATKSLHCL